MLFNSLIFAVFMSIVFIVYWLIPQKFKWIFLLVASYYYYMSWDPKFIIWILITTGISYSCAMFLQKTDEKKKKKTAMLSSLIVSLGILVVFKYFNFISVPFTNLLQIFSLNINENSLKLIMPVGISFYTFQSIGYIVDVYKGKVKAEKHFGKYALFISFFPQVLSGPIARADSLLPQINNPKPFDYEKVAYGIRQMAWGFFKKMVVSSVCQVYVDAVYNNVSAKNGFVLITSTVLYAIQIYCDFSGYSDIAIGTAKILGIDLMTNFKTPYFAQSIKEFWSRWHISLSTWFKDYLYIPLGGNRVSSSRYAFNIVFTFLISGIWHGNTLNFIIWGLLHGILQVIESYVYKIKSFKPKIKEKKIFSFRGIVTLVLTFATICFTWIFFRANTFSDTLYIISNMFSGISSPAKYLLRGYTQLGLTLEDTAILAVSLIILIIGDSFALKCDVYKKIGKINPMLKYLIYFIVIFSIVVFTPSNASQEFIYFNF